MKQSMARAMFFNPYARKDYTLVGLCLFGTGSYPLFKAEFPDEAAAVRAAVDRAVQEDSEVALALSDQKADTGDLDAYMEALPRVMGGIEDKIAAALGRDSKGFKAFFPKGLSEFNKLAKKRAPAVLRRISVALDTYGAGLDDGTKGILRGLESGWTAAREQQQSQMGGLSTERNERGSAREEVEEALWNLALAVLAKYKGDPEKCLSFFRMHLLKEVHWASEAAGDAEAQ
ncbi:MAG: hypothetical protein EOO11_07145 [Chitinophagaceae bacterium]|nr:MAG: hypothetical protein EOO11_07145 [Chitinophagaceae bacterium]